MSFLVVVVLIIVFDEMGMRSIRIYESFNWNPELSSSNLLSGTLILSLRIFRTSSLRALLMTTFRVLRVLADAVKNWSNKDAYRALRIDIKVKFSTFERSTAAGICYIRVSLNTKLLG